MPAPPRRGGAPPPQGREAAALERIAAELGPDGPAAAAARRVVAQMAATDRRRADGVVPAAVVAAGPGEIAAAHAAGALGWDDAVTVACALARSAGGTEMTRLDVTGRSVDVRARCRTAPVALAVTGTPAPGTVSVVCRTADRTAARDHLAAAAALTAEEPGDAWHTGWGRPALDDVRAALRGIAPRPPACPLFAATAGGDVGAAVLDAAYWHWNAGHHAFLDEALAAAVRSGVDRVLDVVAGPRATAWARAIAPAALPVAGAGNPLRSWLAGRLRPAAAPATPPPSLLADAGAQARLRAQAPVHHVPDEDAWLVLGHAQARQVLADTATFSSRAWAQVDPVLLAADPPAHSGPRRAVARRLGPDVVAEIEAHVDEHADALLAGFAGAEELDVLSGLAAPLVEGMVAGLYGLAPDQATAFAAGARGEQGEADLARIGPALDRLGRMPPLQAALAEDPAVDAQQAAMLTRFLWIAGTTTTRRLIVSAVTLLDEQPDVRRQVADDPDALDVFLDEALRLHPPERMIWRTTTEPTTLAGVAIPADKQVYISFVTANRDPAVFPDPERVRLDRPSRHLSFGAGPHRCPGARLARVTAAAACGTLLRRMPDFEIVQPPVARRTWTAFTTPVPEQLVIAPDGRRAPRQGRAPA